MRNLNLLNQFRDESPEVRERFGNVGDATCGMFRVPSNIDKAVITVLASNGEGWDHVSVSRVKRCPNWYEMEFIKHLFFKDEEVVMQLHVASADHISVHPNCLHLWRPLTADIPMPPKWMVA